VGENGEKRGNSQICSGAPVGNGTNVQNLILEKLENVRKCQKK